jgi:hypothetical protein
VQLVREARRLILGRVDAAVMAQGPRIFSMVKDRAAQVVEEIAQLPEIPDGIWPLRDAANELARYRAHRGTWGHLLPGYQTFSLCHGVADLFRSTLGYSQEHLVDAPPWALAYKGWHKVLADPQWANVRKELRLPYAIQHVFEPGLWRPDEVLIRPEDKTFVARLRNLGSAVA